jgi:serine/threonine protein kinase
MPKAILIVVSNKYAGYGDFLFALKLGAHFKERFLRAGMECPEVLLITQDEGKRRILKVEADAEFRMSVLTLRDLEARLNAGLEIEHIIEGPVFDSTLIEHIDNALSLPTLLTLAPEYSFHDSIHRKDIRQHREFIACLAHIKYANTIYSGLNADYDEQGILFTDELRLDQDFAEMTRRLDEPLRSALFGADNAGVIGYTETTEFSAQYSHDTYTGSDNPAQHFLNVHRQLCKGSDKNQDVLLIGKALDKKKAALLAMKDDLIRDGFTKITFFNTDTQEEEVLHDSGDPRKTYRALYAPEVSHKSMIACTALSTRVVGATGDQSLGEAVSGSKIIVYECLPHKQLLIQDYDRALFQSSDKSDEIGEALYLLRYARTEDQYNRLGQLLSIERVHDAFIAGNQAILCKYDFPNYVLSAGLGKTNVVLKQIVTLIEAGREQEALDLFRTQKGVLSLFTQFEGKPLLQYAFEHNRDGLFLQEFHTAPAIMAQYMEHLTTSGAMAPMSVAFSDLLKAMANDPKDERIPRKIVQFSNDLVNQAMNGLMDRDGLIKKELIEPIQSVVGHLYPEQIQATQTKYSCPEEEATRILLTIAATRAIKKVVLNGIRGSESVQQAIVGISPEALAQFDARIVAQVDRIGYRSPYELAYYRTVQAYNNINEASSSLKNLHFTYLSDMNTSVREFCSKFEKKWNELKQSIAMEDIPKSLELITQLRGEVKHLLSQKEIQKSHYAKDLETLQVSLPTIQAHIENKLLLQQMQQTTATLVRRGFHIEPVKEANLREMGSFMEQQGIAREETRNEFAFLLRDSSQRVHGLAKGEMVGPIAKVTLLALDKQLREAGQNPMHLLTTVTELFFRQKAEYIIIASDNPDTDRLYTSLGLRPTSENPKEYVLSRSQYPYFQQEVNRRDRILQSQMRERGPDFETDVAAILRGEKEIAHRDQAFRANGGIYKLESSIGQGGWGAVHLASYYSLDARDRLQIDKGLVIKIPHGREFNFEREMALLQRAYPELESRFSLCQYDNKSCLVMPRFPGMALDLYLSGSKSISFEQRRAIAKDLISELEQIHRKGLTHNDIKPKNILIDPDTSKVRIVDFGCAEEFGTPMPFTSIDTAKFDIEYMPPEYHSAADYTAHPAADIYSMTLSIAEVFGVDKTAVVQARMEKALDLSEIKDRNFVKTLRGEFLLRKSLVEVLLFSPEIRKPEWKEAFKTFIDKYVELQYDFSPYKQQLGDDVIQLLNDMQNKDPGNRPTPDECMRKLSIARQPGPIAEAAKEEEEVDLLARSAP